MLPGYRSTWTLAYLTIASFAILYVLLAVNLIQSGSVDVSFSDLSTHAGVHKLLSDPQATLLAWVHYVAFDLFVGTWEAQDANKRGIPRLLVLPCLLLTWMAGPTGLVLYGLVRFLFGKALKNKPE
ncbi:hypothetical protein WJX72_010103 [[Myrmecia] bisecta]|uniref:DUF4281 domain-containing protein n=1 Tax=[Myrmecia] bisecta TaxID=41462 RepID=A0AAW1R9R0_9CHLO